MSLKVLISGSTGFVGRHLSSHLKDKGLDLYFLVRKKKQEHSIFWDPDHFLLDTQEIPSVDVVIHLCGENVGSFWTASKKEKIYNSRVLTTKFLVDSFIKAQIYPKIFICASAIGYFGSRGDETLTETSTQGEGFLADVCKDWEKQAESLKGKSRVLSLRFGHILGKDGGLLPKLALLYRLGLGGKIGSGQQYISWISIDDICEIVFQSIFQEKWAGAINCVSSEPVQQKEFGRVLAKILRRPFWFHLPEKFLIFFLKEQAKEMFLASQRALPEKLNGYGYSFIDTDLKKTLQKCLKFI